MLKLNARIKIIITVGLFAVFTGFMFSYGYSIFENQNADLLGNIQQKRLELTVLQREQDNFVQGKRDIEKLSSTDYPPEDLFSKDTKVVKEIRKLEELADAYNLDMTLNVSGTSESAVAAEGLNSDLYLVPYTLRLEGAYNNLQRFLQSAEHTQFINHTQQININADSGGEMTATLSSQFYLSK